MKTIKFIIITAFITLNIYSQNITNILGANGLFSIKDASTNYLSLSQSTGDLSLNKNLVLPNTIGSISGVIYKGPYSFLHNYSSLHSNGGNTFLGIESGNYSMSGTDFESSYNTGIGFRTLINIDLGRSNTAVGAFSLFEMTNGIENTAVGYYSLNFNNGHYNTAIGSWSLSANSTGLENTGVGYRSLTHNNTGSQNTALGNGALYSNNLNSGNTAVGWHALYLNTGFQNTAVGHHSMQSNTTGNYNTSIGYNSGSTITTGLNLTCIGIDANPTTPAAVDQITLGNGFVTSLRCNVTTITSLSDMRDKKNIKDLSLGLDFITKLQPRQFNWDKREWYDSNKSDGSKMDTTYTAGFIAQELDEVQSTENAEWLKLVLKDNPEKWEATPGNLLPIMVKAIQELKAENNNLKAELESMKKLEERITVLEQNLVIPNDEVKTAEK